MKNQKKVINGKIDTLTGELCMQYYPNIDMVETGKLLKHYIERAGYSVKDIQRHLQLSCPQPIYRWYKGQILPSVDHLYTLSRLLNVHMEELLVPRNVSCFAYEIKSVDNLEKRIFAYWSWYQKTA